MKPRRYREGDAVEVAAYYACFACGEVTHYDAGKTVGACDEGHFEWVQRVGGPVGAITVD